MNELLTYAVMLDLLIAAYIHFVVMLTELKKLLRQELNCLCRSPPQSYQNGPHQILWLVSYIFTAL